jgi:AhpC/TSA family
MRWLGRGLLAALLALPAAWADDPPKDKGKDPAKDEKAQATPKEQFSALAAEYFAQQRELVAKIQKTKGDEQKELIKKYRGLGDSFADKFYKLVEDHPKDPVATDALFWIVQNADKSDARKKASEKVLALVAEMPLKDLTSRLNRLRATDDLQAAALKRAAKDETDPLAADLVAWAATNGAYLKGAEKAFDRLIEKYPDHKSMERVCQILGQHDDLPTAEAKLKTILAKNNKPKVQAAGHFALGELLADKANNQGDNQADADRFAAEAEKYFTKAIDLYGKDNSEQQERAEKEVQTLKTRRVGLGAPDIKAKDLDGKEFKLSDYRGKVVLLDFWGNW